MRRTVVFTMVLAVSVLLCGCSGSADPARKRAIGQRVYGDSSDGAALESTRRPAVTRSRTRPRREAEPDSKAMLKEEKGEWSKAPTSDDSSAKRETGIQSGTLTAGSFDDVDRFEDFRRFVCKAVERDIGEQLPRLVLGRRAMIHVADAHGRPVADARVVVRPIGRRRRFGVGSDFQTSASAVLDLWTGTDGRTMLLTGVDTPSHSGPFSVTVHPPDGSNPVERTMHLDQQPWRIRLPGAAAAPPKRLDLALVVDTTGSMGDELEYLKVEIQSIARRVYEMFPNVDQRYALILYRDDGDQYVTRKFDFTASLASFSATLSDQSAGGGGDYPEAMHLALENAAKLDWRNRDTARVLFLVGDAPPHDRFAQRTLDAVGTLRDRGVRVFPVASSGVKLKAEFVMRTAAFLTMGQYLFLTDHSGVGNSHAKPHVPDYRVERLDRLMIRMIASELSGRRLEPGQALAVRQVERGHRAGPADMPPARRQEARPLPRWTILAAVLLGVCIFDSLASRRCG